MISVIIPTLNEEDWIRSTIEHTLKVAQDASSLEVLVVDAGSEDTTLAQLDDLPIVQYVDKNLALKKYASMNAGLERAKGEIILFLDADTLLPNGFDQMIRRCLSDKKVVGGGFEFLFLEAGWKYVFVMLFNRARYRLTRIFYGDQAVFARREVLNKIGGVPKEPLMETAYLCKSLKKEGKLAIVNPPIRTSPRRFEEHGFFKTSWFDLIMIIRFNLGLSVANFSRKYWGKNMKR